MTTPNQVLFTLSNHIGKGRGISVKQLSTLVGVNPRMVRLHVSQLREEGYAVCGTPRTGYYMAETAEDLEETCKFLRGRAMHSLVLEAALRKMPLPDLIGQMKLRT
ncbi:HTH domain-containing protein [Nitrosospira lacus]|uniref:Uncharacterized protein n=1 Tax=Nitrosospira lacus TaxID=1288494 RepID=A0A1W6SQT1_9PROT|nr:HTH domain-containing protein [Nitrosospira lacus]ARO88143.1 HTH domain-containing protein [Nitrosospira lacus]